MIGDTKEILRYLGYRKQEPGGLLLEAVHSCRDEMIEAVSPRMVCLRLPVMRAGEPVLELSALMVKSRALWKHLAGCDECFLFAATLGPAADLLLSRNTRLDMSRALISEAVATALIEEYCDECCAKLGAEIQGEGLFLRPRFSPGYGDFPISHQGQVLALLEAQKKIGLTLTDGGMLAPSKSVTAVIGLTREPQCYGDKCAACDNPCDFRKGT